MSLEICHVPIEKFTAYSAQGTVQNLHCTVYTSLTEPENVPQSGPYTSRGKKSPW